jgi:signal transduction histidine kinase
MTSLLNDFLSITKLEEGKVSIAYQLFDLERFCKEIAEEMQGIAKAGQKIIFKHTSERTLVWQDPNILRNIIFNLVGNALKYSPENSPVYITSSANENEILITVADKGIGIPKKDQALMFERFFRAGNSTNIQGTGLGLNIVKKYLENLEGSISFKSEENIGTTFYITLPIKD